MAKTTRTGCCSFPRAMDMLFASAEQLVWFNTGNRGTGHAFGQYVEGRIEALYNGQVTTFKNSYSDARYCYASNHPLTFVRR